jgi:hypothetical protein
VLGDDWIATTKKFKTNSKCENMKTLAFIFSSKTLGGFDI